ncbi:MAG: VOC family protein [Clostridiales bacterium]|nr:VOC family protein [Clostridiales bacterium]
MKFRMAHLNLNVKDLDVSLKFYKEEIGMNEIRRHEAKDGSFIIVFLEDAYGTTFNLELTWLRDHPQKYDLGEEEYHLAFYIDEYEKVKQMHKDAGLITYDTEGRGYHFILDPDGYWLEFFPER